MDVEKPWLEIGPENQMVGRDPRKLSRDELIGLGHKPMSPLEALRARCLDCCAGSAYEVRNCTARKCPSWPFRMGNHPWLERVAPVLTAEQKAERNARLARLNADRKARRDGTFVEPEKKIVEEVSAAAEDDF